MSIDLQNLTERQMIAITHPTIDDVDAMARHGLTPPPAIVKRRNGLWVSILEVRCLVNGQWCWVASVSRRPLHQPRPILLGKWKPKWRPEAETILDGLLAGVGDDEITLPFAGDELASFRSYQRWRSLSADEQAIALTHAHPRKDPPS